MIISPQSRSYKYLAPITCLYLTMQLVSDVTAGKITTIAGFPVSVTVLWFPVTYIFADVLTEVYGYARARSAVWIVFFGSVIAGIVYQIAVWLPPAPTFENADAYEIVLGSVPRILVGGWIAVWVGGIANDYVLAKMKVWTGGRHLWTRTIGSTIIGEFANTTLFYVIALYAVLPTKLLVASILTGWVLKVAVEIVFTPWTYWVVARLKRLEGEDYYDTATNFNPFILRPPESP